MINIIIQIVRFGCFLYTILNISNFIICRYSVANGTCIVKNVIGKILKEDLTNNLKTSQFSVIIDESTDVGTIKTLCICVR